MEINITRDLPVKSFNRHWQFCVGSPHATYALRRDWTRQLSLIHEELGIERVRFHGIFCDDMHTYHKASDLFPIPGGNAFTEQSFRWCAAAYDNVLSAGMKPFVELSFMPRHLAKKNKKGMFFYKPNVSPPKSYEKWEEFIKDFITFLIDRYGRQEIRSWYFEVWNEPDLRLPFFAGTKKDYFRLYASTVNAIKNVDSEIRVGGPSTSGSKWLEEFLEYCKQNSVPVDFVTTHQYSGDPLGGIEDKKEKASISINPFAGLGKNTPDKTSVLPVFRKLMCTDRVYSSFKKDNLIKSSLSAKRQTGNLPLFYTEWNLCAAFSAECNDTRMVAAYDVHSILGSADSIDGSSIWCFTDLFEELHPFAEEFHGGFGMLTQSGIKKPIFHALKLLSQVSDNRIILPESHSDVTLAAFRSEQALQIIATLPVLDGSKKKEDVTLNVQLSSLLRSVTVSRIDENSGNPLKIWQEIGSPQVPNFAQLEIIEAESAVKEEPLPFEYEDGNLKLHFTLNENDVYLIKIN